MFKSKTFGMLILILFTAAMVVTIIGSFWQGYRSSAVLAAAGLAYVYGFYTGEDVGPFLKICGTVLALLAVAMQRGLL